MKPSAPLARKSSDEGSLDVLVHTTYEAIKRDILGNRLRPGAKLIHRSLAESLGVSRTPVRESLERLYQEGYVTRIQNRGYYVAEIDMQEVRDLYATREALESFALRQVMAAGVSAAQLKPVHEVNARYRDLCQHNLSRERLLVDREFHLALAGLSGNAYLCRTLAAVFDRLILKRRVEGFHDTRGLEPHKDHVRLLAAIAKGEAAAAQDILHLHIDSACGRLVHYLQEGAAEAGRR